MAYEPKVRKPTGIPAAPLVMVSGPPKSGRSLNSYLLGRDELIENCWVIDLGEGTADEYGELGCYEVLEWGRTFADLTDTIKWCVAQKPADGKLNAVIVDSGTELWDSLKIRADQRARNNTKNKKALEQDPDFEVDVSMPYWNDAKDVWARIISPLKLSVSTVGVVIVRTDVVAEVNAAGIPTKNKVESLQCEKSLPAAVTAHVKVAPDHSCRLVEVRSLKLALPPAGIPLDKENPLVHMLHLVMPASGGFAAPVVHRPLDEERFISRDQIAVLVGMITEISDEPVKAGIKAAFNTEFGLTKEIPVQRFDEAARWLRGRVDRWKGESPKSPEDGRDESGPSPHISEQDRDAYNSGEPSRLATPTLERIAREQLPPTPAPDPAEDAADEEWRREALENQPVDETPADEFPPDEEPLDDPES